MKVENIYPAGTSEAAWEELAWVISKTLTAMGITLQDDGKCSTIKSVTKELRC